jgi:hypothetical protein
MRTTSHARLRARNNYYTSSALIGGKGGAGPSSLYTTLEGPPEYANARWNVKSTWVSTWRRMDMFAWSLGLFSKSYLLEVGLTQNQETVAL